MNKPLGRRTPTNFEHVEKYPLSALPESEVPTKVPFAIGVNWYSDFDNPIQYDFTTLEGTTVKRWVVAKNGIKGHIRGGHCVCIKPGSRSDPYGWWDFYNQGAEGACVGFGSSRMMSLLNRKKYNARWLWDWAKSEDEWGDTNPGDDNGTSVNAALQVLSAKGHVVWGDAQKTLAWQQRDQLTPTSVEGISAYRWTRSIDEMRTVLASPLNDRMQAFPFLNSWGRSYPHVTWLPYEAMSRLIREDGEVAIITDR
jgi:hypothetical protein